MDVAMDSVKTDYLDETWGADSDKAEIIGLQMNRPLIRDVNVVLLITMRGTINKRIVLRLLMIMHVKGMT